MDTYEATKVVMSRIQNLDPDNASKIMGYILIQDHGEKEMIRLAFGPESALLAYMNEAKVRLRLGGGVVGSNGGGSVSGTVPVSSSFPSPRIQIPVNNGFHRSNPPSPAFPSGSPSPSPRPVSYAAVLNGSGFENGSGPSNWGEYGEEFGMMDPVMSPGGRSDSLVFPYGEDSGGVVSPFHHRRSCSVNDAAFLEEGGGGFGWRPCMYYARGYCKNGSSCKFYHGDDGLEVGCGSGSPGKISGFDELLRYKAMQQQQQRLALMAAAGGGGFGGGYGKCLSFMNENHSPRSEFGHMGFGCGSSSSRQIYLTFPADSTFKEEDVSTYFNMFGPVQDVRIPYQQKRMFGFVTFVFPETVKLILAKGNPHFVCDSRVLVKPYKEKGKIPEKKQHQLQHMDSGEYSACLSPSGMDARDHFDLPFAGSRMLTHEMMLRRKFEHEAELQHAIEVQGRRMMNFQLMDLKSPHHNHNFLPSSPSGVPMFSPRHHSPFLMNPNAGLSPDVMHREYLEELDARKEPNSPDVGAEDDEKVVTEVNSDSSNKTNPETGDLQEHVNVTGEPDLSESLEHNLPDNFFASPTKSAAEQQGGFSSDENLSITNPSFNKPSAAPASSPLGMAPMSSYFQMHSH